jgi:hypothetical protein
MNTMTWYRIVPNGAKFPSGVYRTGVTKDFLADHDLVNDEDEIANARTSEQEVANAGNRREPPTTPNIARLWRLRLPQVRALRNPPDVTPPGPNGSP